MDTQQSWHCYTEHYESVVSTDVTATRPEEAARMAAEETGIAATWVVVCGRPSAVKVTATAVFGAELIS